MRYSTRFFLTLGFLGSTALVLQTEEAYAYDMDCKVILCIAGGFPAGCADAYKYMIKRITRFPKPLPPFGFCAMSDGSEYKAHRVNYSYLGQGPQAYDCPEGKQLYYRREEGENGRWGREITFCYSHSATQQVGSGRDQHTQTVFRDRSKATPVNFQLKIIIEPGTEHEFISPLFRINWSTGYVSQRKI